MRRLGGEREVSLPGVRRQGPFLLDGGGTGPWWRVGEGDSQAYLGPRGFAFAPAT
jgi:hypothetical protein